MSSAASLHLCFHPPEIRPGPPFTDTPVKVRAAMASSADVSLHGSEDEGELRGKSGGESGSYYQLAIPAFHWTTL